MPFAEEKMRHALRSTRFKPILVKALRVQCRTG